MIQATELRIGNWIRKIDGRGNYQIDAEILCSLANSTPEEIEEEFIPLTEDWLKDFGFKKSEGGLFYIKNFGIDLSGTFIHAILRYVDFSFEERRLTRFAALHNDVRYIHQLQNLYFAITGEELEIKQSAPQQ